MAVLPSLIILDHDFAQLIDLVEKVRTPTSELLEVELSRAQIVPSGELPSGVVQMNSVVRYEEVGSGKQYLVRLAYPHEIPSQQDGRQPLAISVLAPMGAALIGLSVGQNIEWSLPQGGVKKIVVLEVLRSG